MSITSPPGLLKILDQFGRLTDTFSSGTNVSIIAPAGTRQVHVEVWGAGGGGGAGTPPNWPFSPGGEPIGGPGGGGGAYATAVIDVDATSTTPITYTVGQGGPAQAGAFVGEPDPFYIGGDGGASSITVGSTTITAAGGKGGWSFLSESNPVTQPGVFDVFNQVVGAGGSPNGNNGIEGLLGGGSGTTGNPEIDIFGFGGSPLGSAYTVNGLTTWFGGSFEGEGGGGELSGSPIRDGANGFIIVRYIGNVADNNLTAFYRDSGGGGFLGPDAKPEIYVPDAAPNTAIATSGNLSIASFDGAALNVVAGSQPTIPPPTQPDPIQPDQVTVTISTVTGPGGTAISTSPSGAAQFTPGGNATITINNANPFAGNQDTPTLSQSNSTCVGGVPPSITTVQSGQQWQFEFLVPPNNCTLEFIAGALLGGGGGNGDPQ